MPSDDLLLSDTELLDAIMRDMRTIYTEIIKQPLPAELTAALRRLEVKVEGAGHILLPVKRSIGD